jgi:hypothetical protein
MGGKRRRLSKKECERLKQKRVKEEAKARSDSEDRQARIKQLWNEITSGHLVAKEDDKEGLAAHPLVVSLVELADLQKREIEYMRPNHWLCEWAETHAPNEVAALKAKHPFSVVLAHTLARAIKLAPKQKQEQDRRHKSRYRSGLIEYEFGGEADARLGAPYDPTCLDDIFCGYGVNMDYLEILFGLERHRFPKTSPRLRVGRKILYFALDVVKIMDALLNEKSPERKRRARGRPRKQWLSDPDVRKRVLMGIGSRALVLSMHRDILGAFLAVVCCHSARWYPKEQLPEGFDDKLAILKSRYLSDSGKK